MTYTSKTHSFFKEKVYNSLYDFALSPVSWAFKEEPSSYIPIPNISNLLLAAVLWPILVPATIMTTAISFALAAVSALIHGFSLLVSNALDAAQPTVSAPAI